MRVTNLVQEARFAAVPAYSLRELRMGMKTLDHGTRVVTVSGGTPQARADLRTDLATLMNRNEQWGLVPFNTPGRDDLLSYVVATASAHGVALPERTALRDSARKLSDALHALSLTLSTKPVFMLDAERWPARVLADLVRIESHRSHGNYRFMVFGPRTSALVPANAPTHHVAGINLP